MHADGPGNVVVKPTNNTKNENAQEDDKQEQINANICSNHNVDVGREMDDCAKVFFSLL